MRSFKSILFVIFVAALTVNLTGCKDDDETASEKIVGTWYYEGNRNEDKYVFNADGTGAWIYESEGAYEPFTYAYDEKAGTISFLSSDGEVDSCFVSIDGNTMYLYDSDGIEYAEVYVRG